MVTKRRKDEYIDNEGYVRRKSKVPVKCSICKLKNSTQKDGLCDACRKINKFIRRPF